jgi:hypothetical protein
MKAGFVSAENIAPSDLRAETHLDVKLAPTSAVKAAREVAKVKRHVRDFAKVAEAIEAARMARSLEREIKKNPAQ